MWHGNYMFLLENLIQKDFKVRYRNMSLGVLWSLLNPLVTMAALTFVFTKMFTNPQPNYPAFVLCGLVPFNFFTMAWATGTSSLLDNAMLIKRVPIPREIVPIASVLGNCLHLIIQIALLLSFTLAFGKGINRYWFWLPVIWVLEIVLVSGLALISSAINVYVRDTRYIVESINVVLFWLVPVVYSFEVIPMKYHQIYEFNPLAAIVFASRKILLEAQAPATSTLVQLAVSSVVTLGFGLLLFSRLKTRFYDYL